VRARFQYAQRGEVPNDAANDDGGIEEIDDHASLGAVGARPHHVPVAHRGGGHRGEVERVDHRQIVAQLGLQVLLRLVPVPLGGGRFGTTAR